MKKKLLSTLAAVSMLTNLVTPVLAAPPSHEGEGHYSYATGQEGLVTEASFLKEQYTMTNGDDDNFLDELMAFVDDNTLAHELRYVEWYIENHDSNYPFSLASTTDGNVYCGFDSGSATLTAVITRNDGSLVKASTKLVAQAKTIQYATGFYFTDTSKTLYTGPSSISGGDMYNTSGGFDSDVSGSFNRITIEPTPSNAVFSEVQAATIKAAIDAGQLDVSLRTSTSDSFDSGYIISNPTVEFKSWDSFNGYEGWGQIRVSYPIGTSGSTTSATYENGVMYLEINTNATDLWVKGSIVDIDDVEIEGSGGTGVYGSSNFVEDLVEQLNASNKFDADFVSRTGQYTSSNSNRIIEITLKEGSSDYDSVFDDIMRAMMKLTSGSSTWDTSLVDYAKDVKNFTIEASNNMAKTYLNDMIAKDGEITSIEDGLGNSHGLYMTLKDKDDYYQLYSVSDSTFGYNNANTTASDNFQTGLEDFLDYNAANANEGFKVSVGNTSSNISDIRVQIFDNDKDETEQMYFLDWDGLPVYMTISDPTVSWVDSDESAITPAFNSGYNMRTTTTNPVFANSEDDGFSSKVYFTLVDSGADDVTWGSPTSYRAVTTGTAVSSSGLRGYGANYGTTAFDYTLAVSDFTRYQGTYPAETLDNVERSIRINSNVAVQPSSYHQTSSITVAVGDVMDLQSHFRPTSTANVYWDPVYDEAFFNNDSSYAYNDYGVILEDEEEVLGVRTGKNKIVGAVYNSHTGATHSAEVIVTVVPRTGTSTTVTPTSSPLSITPTTHTTTLGGAGVQLTAKYYGENTFDVNDNVLPTLQSSSNGQIQDVVEFISNDPTVLSVNEDGFVTPVGVGTGTVTVKVPNSDFESTFTMTVIAPTIPQEETNTDGTVTGPTNVPSTGVNALGQLF